MATSRSYKPTSYLTASQHQNRRPSYNRSSSSSSNTSNNSLDSLAGNFKGLGLQQSQKGKERENLGNSPTSSPRGSENSTATAVPFDTPTRKKSDPIPITIGSASIPKTRVYTPLTARGDLPGGYFPSHFGHQEAEGAYKSHPFNDHHKKAAETPDEPQFIMSPNGSPMESPSSDSTARAPNSLMTSPFAIPEALIIPKGKYYPSNYQPSPTSPNPMITLPGTLQLPSKKQRQKPANPNHQRKTSDVKRKLQQYQRDMIEQARLASIASSPGVPSVPGTKPISPKLLPLGSPGPITPFELEDCAGYLIAGQRRTGGLIGDGSPEQDAVERMIRAEEERRRREGQSSPVARV